MHVGLCLNLSNMLGLIIFDSASIFHEVWLVAIEQAASPVVLASILAASLMIRDSRLRRIKAVVQG